VSHNLLQQPFEKLQSAQHQHYRSLWRIVGEEQNCLAALRVLLPLIQQHFALTDQQSIQCLGLDLGLDLDLDVGSVESLATSENSNAHTDKKVRISSCKLPHINQVRQQLGRNNTLLILNAFQGINPNFTAMLSGTVIGGGLIILLSPNDQDWPNFLDPDYQKLSIQTTDVNSDKLQHHRYLTRGLNLIHKIPEAYHHCFDSEALKSINSQTSSKFIQSLNSNSGLNLNLSLSPRHIPEATPKPKPSTLSASSEQSKLIQTLLQQYQLSHRCNERVKQQQSISVIEGDRGRGKSTATALFVQALLNLAPQAKIAISAPKSSNLQNFYNALQDRLSEQPSNSDLLEQVQFIAPDQLAQSEASRFDLVIIEEAAALATHFLKSYLHLAKHLIFVSTISGYEGNGRGFAIRFDHYLQNLPTERFHYKKYQLKQAYRYANQDPIEDWINQWSLLKSQALKAYQADHTINYAYISQDHLAENEPLLQSVYGLLLNAHYQTSADDARFILDFSKLKIAIAYQGELNQAQVLAACLLVEEGQFSQELCQSFENDIRRFRGHIIPQQLANISSCDWLKLPYLRIVRIATDHRCREKCIAKTLIQKIEHDFPQHFLGASFAIEEGVLRFWQHCGFKLMQLGLKQESSTGSLTAIVLRTPQENPQHKLWQAHSDWLQQDLTRRHKHLNLQLKQELLNTLNQLAGLKTEPNTRKSSTTAPSPSKLNTILSPIQYYQLQRFCQKQLALAQIEGALLSLALHIQDLNIHLDETLGFQNPQMQLQFEQTLIDRYRDFQDIQTAFQSFNINGSKAWQSLCRRYVQAALAALKHD